MARIERDAAALRALLQVLYRLRAPDGCPWDRAQTVASLAPFLLEESFEAVDAIGSGTPRAVCEELGDALMNVLLLALAGEDEGSFTPADVAEGIASKLVRRHPHVFGETRVAGVPEVWANWERIKADEKRARGEDASAVAGIPAALPACLRALRTIEKASRAGFRWPDRASAVAKVDEEWRELRAEIEGGTAERVEEELGDLLLSVVTLAHHVSVNPETALRRSTYRFVRRFRRVERALGAGLADASIDDLRARWTEAKAAETGDEGARGADGGPSPGGGVASP